MIVDSAIAIAWCFTDENDDYSQAVLDALASEPAFVPDLWHLEVANTLLVGERRKRSTQAETATWLGFLAALPITVDEEMNAQAFADTMHLARRTTFPPMTQPIWNWPCVVACRWRPWMKS